MITRILPRPKEGRGAANLARYMAGPLAAEAFSGFTRAVDYITDGDAGAATFAVPRDAFLLPDGEATGVRVAGIRVTNCATSVPSKALEAILATQADHRTQPKPSAKDRTMHMVISFPPGERPSLAALADIEDSLLASIGMDHHQRISAIHDDKDHYHLHVLVNRIEPVTLRYAKPSFDMPKLMRESARLEAKHGLQQTHHANPQQDRAAFAEWASKTLPGPLLAAADWPAIHAAAAAQGVSLQPRSNGLVVRSLTEPRLRAKGSDAHADLSLPALEKRLGAFQAAPAGLLPELPQPALPDHSERIEATGAPSFVGWAQASLPARMLAARDWPAMHAIAAEHRVALRLRGAGLVVQSLDAPTARAKASDVHPDLSLPTLEARLGAFQSAPPLTREPPIAPDGAQPYQPPARIRSSALYGAYKLARDEAADQQTKAQIRLVNERDRALAELAARRQGMAAALAAAERSQIQKAFKDANLALTKSRFPTWTQWLATAAERGDVAAARLHGQMFDDWTWAHAVPTLAGAPDWRSLHAVAARCDLRIERHDGAHLLVSRTLPALRSLLDPAALPPGNPLACTPFEAASALHERISARMAFDRPRGEFPKGLEAAYQQHRQDRATVFPDLVKLRAEGMSIIAAWRSERVDVIRRSQGADKRALYSALAADQKTHRAALDKRLAELAAQAPRALRRRDWLVAEAKSGNAEALACLRTDPSPARPMNGKPDLTLAPMQPGADVIPRGRTPTAVFPDGTVHYDLDGALAYDRAARIDVFIEHPGAAARAYECASQLADARFAGLQVQADGAAARDWMAHGMRTFEILMPERPAIAPPTVAHDRGPPAQGQGASIGI